MHRPLENGSRLFMVGISMLLGLTTTVIGQTTYPLTVVTTGTSWDIGSDNNGNLYIMWCSGSTIYLGEIINHAVTGQQTAVTGVNTSKYCIPRLSVRPNGQSMSIVHVSADQRSLKHAWRDSGGTWHNETILGPLSYNIYYPAGAVGGDATLHVIYSLGAPYNKLYYIHKNVAGAWSSPIELGYPNAESARMIVDPNGGIHCTWMPYDSYINYRYAALGETLDNSVTEKINGSSTVGTGGLAATHSGFVHVSPNFGRKVWHTYKTVGSGSFATLTCPTITTVDYTELINNAVGADDETGRVYVSWTDKVNDVFCVKVSVLENKVWTVSTVDSQANTGSLASTFPAIAMTNQAAYLLWRHSDNHLYLGEYLFIGLKVIAPNGGESISLGSSQEISWTSIAITANVKIELIKGETWLGTIADDLDVNSSPYTWTAGDYWDAAGAPQTAPIADNYRIKISTMDNSYSDTSDAYFTLANAALPSQAREPDPANGATKVELDAHLSWTADRADTYDVYFGATNPPPFRGNQAASTYDPGPLDHLAAYFWRIDGINDLGTTTGKVWSFTTRTYVGDFDEDLDVDQTDFGYFQGCYSGAGYTFAPGCAHADLDSDVDVDLDDLALFQTCMAGANQPPACQ